MADDTTTAPNGGVGTTIIGVVGLLGYLAVGFLYLVSGLTVPVPWLWLLWVIWLAGLYPLIATFRTRRIWTPIVPVIAVAFWFLYVSAGEALFDWTA